MIIYKFTKILISSAESDRNHRNFQINHDIFDPIFAEIEHQSVLKMKIHAINPSDLDFSVNFEHYRASQAVGGSHVYVISDHIVSDHSVIFDPMKTTSQNMRQKIFRPKTQNLPFESRVISNLIPERPAKLPQTPCRDHSKMQ